MSLINFLKDNKNTRKLFGERELKIIEKQLHGINLTQSEKNRLSRDIRKKFEFIREVIRFSNDFELKKGSIIKEYIEEAKEVILNDILHKKIDIQVYNYLPNKVKMEIQLIGKILYENQR